MKITINSNWNLKQYFYYLESTLGTICSPIKIEDDYFSVNKILTEEQLLALLVTYDLKIWNRNLYANLIKKISKTSAKHLFNSVLIKIKNVEELRNLYEDPAICNLIKKDIACLYLYYNPTAINNYTYEQLKQSSHVTKHLNQLAIQNIQTTRTITPYNYIGVPHFQSLDEIINTLDIPRNKDINIKEYLIPFLSEEIKLDHKFWEFLLSFPQSYISITSEEYRIQHFNDYLTKNKKCQDINRLYQSLSPLNRIQYSEVFLHQNTSKKLEIIIKPDLDSCVIKIIKSLNKATTNIDEIEKVLIKVINDRSKEYLEQLLKSLTPEDTLFASKNIMPVLINKIPHSINNLSRKLLKDKKFMQNHIEYLPQLKERTGIEFIGENGSIAITPNTPAIYKFHYEPNEWTPSGLSPDKLKTEELWDKEQKYEYLFICYSYLIEPIYYKYYPKYLKGLHKLAENQKISQEMIQQKANLLDFLTSLLLNDKNFDRIYNDETIDIISLNTLRKMLITLKPDAHNRLKILMLNKRKIELKKYNQIVISHLNGEDFENSFREGGLSREELISSVMQIKSLFSLEKESLLNILLEAEYSLTEKDIIYLLEEMDMHQMTIDEILEEHHVNKNVFYKIYKNSQEDNPELFKQIREKLRKNQNRGLIKIKRLAILIVQANPQTEQEFKDQFANANIFEILEVLNRTKEEKLSKNLNHIISNWYKSPSSKKRSKSPTPNKK